MGLTGLVCSTQARRADTVPELDISKYIGRWYQAYGNRFGWLSYGDDAVCITATYTQVNETLVSVYNHNRVALGDGEEPGQFVLRLDGVPFEGSYWVLKLGPVVDRFYDYSVVTSEDFLTLFLLTRNLDRFKELYEDEVLAFVEEEGFTGYWTKPIPDYHPSNCQYPPEPAVCRPRRT